jgi:hypothetical protein
VRDGSTTQLELVPFRPKASFAILRSQPIYTQRIDLISNIIVMRPFWPVLSVDVQTSCAVFSLHDTNKILIPT